MEPNWKATDSSSEPDAHTHAHEEEFVVDPEVEAYVTTLTITVAHGNDADPYKVVGSIAAVVEEMGLQGVVTAVSTVELRGAGGLIGL